MTQALYSIIEQAHGWMTRVPHSFIALLARIGIAAVFWQSGQTKIEGFVLNLATGEFVWGWPRLTDSAVALFAEEYRLPLLSPLWAAPMAAVAEHVLPVLLVMGLATRWAALGLLGMTLVIQLFVYPDAFWVHSLWAATLLLLVRDGAGSYSLDALIHTLTCKPEH